MPSFEELLRRNRTFADSDAGTRARLTAMPDNRVFLVTCLDPRVEPAGFLGVGTGDAIVLRNPGGRVTGTTVADIALISFMGEVMGADGPPLEVAVVHHTLCGMGFLADEQFRSRFAERTGATDAELAARAVTDPWATVRQDVQRLVTSPLMTSPLMTSPLMTSPRITVSGHVLDLASGLVSTVVPVTAPLPSPQHVG